MRPEIIRVEARGQKWSGTYEVDAGEVCVSSAYGSTKEKLGRRQPEKVASKLLVDQVEAWARRRKG